MAAKAQTLAPIAAMNVTPLIDVLLVLLIMMIMTIPLATHKVTVDLPQSDPLHSQLIKQHRLDITASGALALDGVAISEATLPDQLVGIVDDKGSTLTINTDAAAPYATFDRVLAAVKRGGVTKVGFMGNERFANSF